MPCRAPVTGVLLLSLATAACAGEPPRAEPAADTGAAPAETAPAEPAPAGAPERLRAEVLATFPHDPEAFTQGLLVHDGLLYESTGRYGHSSLRKVEPETGEVLVERELPSHLFGEGLARVGSRLVQITWQEGIGLLWNLPDLEPGGEVSYRGEGWGLTFDGDRLVMSDGSAWLVFRDPGTFQELDRVLVTLGGRPVPRLNELEWVDGAVWANVWGSSSVMRIDPGTGAVSATADLSELTGLLPPEDLRRIDVLNGIAWWPEREAFVVTGKLWPRAFLVRLE